MSMASDMLKVMKCKTILSGFFSLPDIFVNRDNYLHNEISKGEWGNLYRNQSNLNLTLENFEGPRRLPKERERNKFWRGLLGFGFWNPFFYISSNDLKIEFTSCDERDSESLFEKIRITRKSPPRLHIRVFQIGGFSIQMIVDFDMSFNSNQYLTYEDLEKIVCEFFDSINISLFKKDEVTIGNQTIADSFRSLGTMVRARFLNTVDEDKYLGMAEHTVLDIKDFEGSWSPGEIAALCGQGVPICTSLEELLEHKIGNPYEKYQKEDDIRFSGETGTLICTQGMKKRGRKYNVDEIYDAIELIYLRKLIIEEYSKFTKLNALEVAKRFQDNLPKQIKKKIIRDKLSWIDVTFLTYLEQLLRLEYMMQDKDFYNNHVKKALERIEYVKILENLKADLTSH